MMWVIKWRKLKASGKLKTQHSVEEKRILPRGYEVKAYSVLSEDRILTLKSEVVLFVVCSLA